MERLNLRKEKLISPMDFTSPAITRSIQEDLVPPSHFASSLQSCGENRQSVHYPATLSSISWVIPGATSVSSGNITSNSRHAISQAQKEICELKQENQRLTRLQKGEQPLHLWMRPTEKAEQWSRWESEKWLEAEKSKAEVERLKGQVEALKETAESYRKEVGDKDMNLNRNLCELKAARDELSNTKTELTQIREERALSSALTEEIRSQLQRLKADSDDEIAKLKRDIERSKKESQEITLKVEREKFQAEQEALKLSQQLEDMQKKQEVELQQLNASHCAELDAARRTNAELESRLQSVTSEVLQLRSSMMEASAEKDGLKEHLSQMGQAFQTQSETLQSLRNYIGQFTPEKGEKEQLNEAIEKLKKEKVSLQTTAELLTVRLNSVNEILALQEEKLNMKASTYLLNKNGCEAVHMLQLWREKVFKLCVQLRTKDIELRREKEELLSTVRSKEQQLEQEHQRAAVLQHSLQDKTAELDLERVEKEALKEDLAKFQEKNVQMKLQSRSTEAEVKTLVEQVYRFSHSFESKVAELDAAKARLNTFTQRLTFAQRRVETIQGLLLRRAALQKVERVCKRAEQAADTSRLSDLQTEHKLVCEERDRLTQELKRTPELIEKALTDLKLQYESKAKLHQQELEQSWMKLQQAVAVRQEAEQSLQQTRAQLEESEVSLEKLRCELLSQQQHSEQALQDRVSEIEERCAEKLREMEVQVDMARRGHTKAVVTLRQFEREAARKRDAMTELQSVERMSFKKKDLKTLPKEAGRDANLTLVTDVDGSRIKDLTRPSTTVQPISGPSRIDQLKPADRSVSADERLLCVLEELQALSVAVVNTSEEEEEEEDEEGNGGSVGATASLRS
ncbi:coiled-coil alpha-helical rod protein 1 isoform X2 [Gouania willdenowi]|uniref:coiled-coil alpha-helical rod protein 1 isoform X2 n=1 Tax=Gouania willdenowi TaxID=441366 RepID=UPI001054DFE5|nr:coiled-coil alpha-helical rod protein 1 isoform X2 [Gouania willdenowi]